MIHVFRLGPLRAGGVDAFAYAGADAAGTLVPPRLAPSDVEGVSAIASLHPREELRCEPRLAGAARAVGLDVAALPRATLAPRAFLALGLALGPMAGEPRRDVLVRFLEACTRWWRARPWERFAPDAALGVTLTTEGTTRALEVAVLGAGGDQPGVTVFEERGAARRAAAAIREGRMKAARRFACVAVTLDEDPAWAATALDDAFGLPRLPVPIGIRDGKPAPAGDAELHALAAILEAIAELAGARARHAETTVAGDGRSVTALVRPLTLAARSGDDLAEPVALQDDGASATAQTPLDAPCLCGSGRRYERCHLPEDEALSRAARAGGLDAERARSRARRLADRDPAYAVQERLTADALALARGRWGDAFDPEGALWEMGLDAGAARFLLGWCAAHHRGPDGRTALELYVEERGAALGAVARTVVDAQRAAWFSFHEVVDVDPGASITLRDVLAGGTQRVDERSASRVLQPRDVLLGRVLRLGDQAILAGCHPRPLPPRPADEAWRLARGALGVRSRTVSGTRLRASSGLLIASWQTVVRALEAGPPPRVRNSDGDDVLLTLDRFEVQGGRSAEVMATLLALPDAREEPQPPAGDASGRAPVGIAFVRPGEPGGVPTEVVVGRAVVEGTWLRVETNSVRSADHLRARVEAAAGKLVAHRLREHRDPSARPAVRRDAAAGEPAPAPDAARALHAVKAEHYRRWLDAAAPSLRGLTPRAAAARRGPSRRALELLLAEIEHAEGARPLAERFDVNVLRQELGVS